MSRNLLIFKQKQVEQKRDTLEIAMTYKNKKISFLAHVLRIGYVNYIIVNLDSVQIIIEKDEEDNYRALGGSRKIQRV